jgi:hypothetical protein
MTQPRLIEMTSTEGLFEDSRIGDLSRAALYFDVLPYIVAGGSNIARNAMPFGDARHISIIRSYQYFWKKSINPNSKSEYRVAVKNILVQLTETNLTLFGERLADNPNDKAFVKLTKKDLHYPILFDTQTLLSANEMEEISVTSRLLEILIELNEFTKGSLPEALLASPRRANMLQRKITQRITKKMILDVAAQLSREEKLLSTVFSYNQFPNLRRATTLFIKRAELSPIIYGFGDSYDFNDPTSAEDFSRLPRFLKECLINGYGFAKIAA